MEIIIFGVLVLAFAVFEWECARGFSWSARFWRLVWFELFHFSSIDRL